MAASVRPGDGSRVRGVVPRADGLRGTSNWSRRRSRDDGEGGRAAVYTGVALQSAGAW